MIRLQREVSAFDNTCYLDNTMVEAELTLNSPVTERMVVFIGGLCSDQRVFFSV